MAADMSKSGPFPQCSKGMAIDHCSHLVIMSVRGEGLCLFFPE